MNKKSSKEKSEKLLTFSFNHKLLVKKLKKLKKKISLPKISAGLAFNVVSTLVIVVLGLAQFTDLSLDDLSLPTLGNITCSAEKSTDQALASTVHIKTDYGSGSGFFIDKNHVVTNNHVLEEVETAEIYLNDGLKTRGKVVGWDNEADLAVIEADITYQHHLDWARRKPKTGTEITAVGYPHSDEKPLKGDATVTRGIVSATRDGLYGIKYIQTDTQINPGSSGGPMVDKCGNVVAISDIIYQVEERSTPYFYGISVASARSVVGNLLNNPTASKPQGTLPRFEESMDGTDVVSAYYDYINTGELLSAYQLFSLSRQNDWQPAEWTDLFEDVTYVEVHDVKEDEDDPMVVTADLTLYSTDGINTLKRDTTSKWQLKYSQGLLALDSVEVESSEDEALFSPDFKDAVRNAKFQSESYYESILRKDMSNYPSNLVGRVKSLINKNLEIINQLYDKVNNSEPLDDQDVSDFDTYVFNDDEIREINQQFEEIDLERYYDALFGYYDY